MIENEDNNIHMPKERELSDFIESSIFPPKVYFGTLSSNTLSALLA